MTYITLQRLNGYALIHGITDFKVNSPWSMKIDAEKDDFRAIQSAARRIAKTPVYFESTAIRGLK